MKNKKCNSFDVRSTSLNGKLVKEYKNFSEKLDYFYKQGGTDIDLINCVHQISYDFLEPLLDYMLQSRDKFKNAQDQYEFSALYYANLRPLPKSYIQKLQQAQFTEKMPLGFSVMHYQDYSYYYHGENQKTSVVFLGHDKDGAVDINAAHVLFYKGYNVLCIDARVENIRIDRVYEIVYLYSHKKIDLFYIGSHGTESALKTNMHTLPILGYREVKQTQVDIDVEIINYEENAINTATFLTGFAYASSGYTPFFINLLWGWKSFFFPNPNPIKAIVASCNAQLSAHDVREALPQNSEILILGENQYLNGKQHVHHITNLAMIGTFDKLALDNSLSDNISLKKFSDAYTTSIDKHTFGAPYYIFIGGHTFWGTPSTKEFSCLTAFDSYYKVGHQNEQMKLQVIKDFCGNSKECFITTKAYMDIIFSAKNKAQELISMRDLKSNDYADILTVACNFGYMQPNPPLEKMWTKEYVHLKCSNVYNAIESVTLYLYERSYCYYTDVAYPYIRDFYEDVVSYVYGENEKKDEL